MPKSPLRRDKTGKNLEYITNIAVYKRIVMHLDAFCRHSGAAAYVAANPLRIDAAQGHQVAVFAHSSCSFF